MPDTLRGQGPVQKLRGFRTAEEEALYQELMLSNHQVHYEWDKILTTIENLRKKHLSITKTVSQQSRYISRIKRELQFNYPQLFMGDENEKILFLAIRVTKRDHQLERSKDLRRIGIEMAKISDCQDSQSKESGSKYYEDDGKLDHQRKLRKRKAEKSEKLSMKDVRRPKKKVINLTLDNSSDLEVFADNKSLDQDEGESSGSEYVVSDANARAGPSTRSSTSTQTIIVRNNKRRPLITTTKPSKKQKTTESAYTGGIREVERFLKTCVPPMDHFLQNFINYGCDNKEWLRGMSLWQQDDRLRELREILDINGPDAKAATRRMAVATIESGVRRYFLE